MPCILQTLTLTLLKVVLMTTLGLQAATVLHLVLTGVILFMGTQILSTLYPLKHAGLSSSNPVLVQVYRTLQVIMVLVVFTMVRMTHSIRLGAHFSETLHIHLGVQLITEVLLDIIVLALTHLNPMLYTEKPLL